MEETKSVQAGERTQAVKDAIVFLGSDCCGHRFNISGCEFTIPFIGLSLTSWGGEKWPHDLPSFFESNSEGRCTRLTEYGADHCNRVYRQAHK